MAGKSEKLNKNGMTLLEMIISISIMAVIMAAVLPQFQNVLASWSSRRNAAEIIQNGRVLHEHINRTIPEAESILSSSDPDSNEGFIEFETVDGRTCRYELNDNGYVRYGTTDNLADLAGPVSRFNVKCYQTGDLAVPAADPESARVIYLETTFDNPRQNARDRSYVSCILRYADINPQAFLMHHWRCDDQNGNKITDSIGSLDGHAGNQVQLGKPAPRNDLIASVYLNGDLQKGNVRLGKSHTLSHLRDSFTISAWVNPEPTGNKAKIIGNDNPIRGWSFGISDGWLVFTASPDHDYYCNANIPMYQWSHIAAVFDDSCNVTFYLNGQPAGTVKGDKPINIGAANSNWTIGQVNGDEPFKGGLDEIKIFDLALDPQQISFLYSLADPPTEKGNKGNGEGKGNTNNGNNGPTENGSENNGNANGPDQNSSDHSNNNSGKGNGKNK